MRYKLHVEAEIERPLPLFYYKLRIGESRMISSSLNENCGVEFGLKTAQKRTLEAVEKCSKFMGSGPKKSLFFPFKYAKI